MDNIFKKSTLETLCREFGFTPSKRYGQNYLISDAPVKKMIEAADLSKDDTVIEIGPGFGPLTLSLAPLVKKVIAFEIEQKLYSYWEQKQTEHKNVEIIWGNVLKQFSMFNSQFSRGYKVLANIPYQITSPLLQELLEAEHKPERIIFMVQREVAERICAKPGDMSLLAVSVQYYGTPKMIMKVPRSMFWPQPDVDSALLHISNIEYKKNSDQFFRIVKAAFSQKRKQAWKNISNTLQISGDQVKSIMKEVTGNELIRAEEVSVGEWEEVVEAIGLKAISDK